MPLAIGTGLWVGFGILYAILLVSLGIMSLRKGHWLMFIIGIFLPLFWVIGAVMPPSQEAIETGA
jgi:hypothetical protein